MDAAPLGSDATVRGCGRRAPFLAGQVDNTIADVLQGRGDRRDQVGAAREMLVKAWRHASGEPGYGLDSPRVQDLFQHRLQGSIPGPETRAPVLGEARARIETIRQESPDPPSGTARAP
jgi:hypothetical protein